MVNTLFIMKRPQSRVCGMIYRYTIRETHMYLPKNVVAREVRWSRKNTFDNINYTITNFKYSNE